MIAGSHIAERPKKEKRETLIRTDDVLNSPRFGFKRTSDTTNRLTTREGLRLGRADWARHEVGSLEGMTCHANYAPGEGTAVIGIGKCRTRDGG